jgi:peptide/nickel transport system substrate-binding protein
MKKFEELQRQLSEGRITRRDFIGRATALGLVAAVPTLILSEEAQAMSPKSGGHYRQALTGGATTDVLDPAQTLDTYMQGVSFGQLRNNLTEISASGELIGELAESWEASADAATWRFKLRKGVEFHNGKSLDTNDVVASFNHHRGENTKSAAKGIISAVTDVKAEGKDTVVFELDDGNADFPFLVSDYHLVICPANSDGSMDWQSGMGTGGYMLESFNPGVVTLTKRNPNYWKQGRAHFDSVESVFVADNVARTNAVRGGELDSMSNLDLQTVHLLKRVPNLQVFAITGNKHVTMPMFCDQAPFDNNDVRLAMKYAINRQELLDKIIRGQGEIGNDSPVGPANIYRATPEELPQREYDPDKARHHMKKAGLSGAKFKYHVADTAFEGAVDAAQLFVESAKAAGISIEIVREPNDGYWSDVWLKKPFTASYWGGRPTEDWIFSQIYSAGADWNETHWNNKPFNDLLVQARKELNASKRREMYVEMQRLVHNDGGAIVPVFMAYTHAVSGKIGLPDKIANNWELDGHKNAERWWFK